MKKMTLTVVALLGLAGIAVGAEPWLPDAEQKINADLWRQTGVEMPEGLKFYKHAKVGQRLTIISYPQEGIQSQHCHGIFDRGDVLNKIIWRVPGGLYASPKDQWRNATAVAFPPGADIQVYRNMTKVLNSSGSYQDNARLSWVYPNGTIFADLQIRRHDGREWPFELRLRVKKDDAWESTAFRPYAEESELPAGSRKRTWTLEALDEKIPGRKLEAWTIPTGSGEGVKFKPSSLVLASERDDNFVPRNYVGAMANCNACHARSGESGDYAGTAAPGSDGVISFLPLSTATLNTDGFPQLAKGIPVKYVGWYGRDVDTLGRRQR